MKICPICHKLVDKNKAGEEVVIWGKFHIPHYKICNEKQTQDRK